VAVAAITAAAGNGGTPTLTYASGAPRTSTVRISAVAASAAGAAIASPSGGQIRPAMAARAARGMAIATRGTATMFAGMLVSEMVPNAGNSTGNVASWATTLAVRTRARGDMPSIAVKPVNTSTSPSEAATERRNPRESICSGSTTTIAPAASTINVT
jgi:hypothetical protein